jgi:anti-sigma-K factor RskA
MSDIRPDQERDLLAAEYALGLLEGEAARGAKALLLSDTDFAAAVEDWELWLAPLADEAEAADPSSDVWARIERALAAAGNGDGSVVALRRKLRVWRGWAAGMTAVAASLALVLVARAPQEAPPRVERPAAAPVFVASLSSETSETSLAVAYEGARSSLLVTPSRLAGAAGHDHELWIIPPGGQPVSLGLVRPGAPQRLAVPREMAPHFRNRASVALSVEPAGGSPTGQPTGPVIAAGELTSI